jgi:hypothetical protein
MSTQEFLLSPDVAWLSHGDNTIFRFDRPTDEDRNDEEEPATLGSYLIKACPGIDPCAVRLVDIELWPQPGRFRKLKCGCMIVCVDWGTEKLGPLTESSNASLVEWFVDHEMQTAVNLILAMAGPAA